MTEREALKLARTALGVQLDALLGKAGHLRNDDRRRYAENGIKAIDEALAQPEPVAVQRWPSAAIGRETLQDAIERERAVGYREGHRAALVQRTWVGLDEQDFSAINQSCLTKLQAATSAESILKEKNT